MSQELANVRIGLALVLLGLLFGIGLGVSFGVNEEAFKTFIADGVAANPQVHDSNSSDKIWRYVQRAHFHATGIAAFSLALLAFVTRSTLNSRYKAASSILIGLGNLYPLSWFMMFLLAPAIGRDAAHDHFLTESFTYTGVAGLLGGILVLSANVFIGAFAEDRDK